MPSPLLDNIQRSADPRYGFGVIVVASSAGGIVALKDLLSVLPRSFPLPIVIAQHLCQSSRYRSVLNEVLDRCTELDVKWAQDGEWLRPGTVYIAPQDHHTMVQEGGRIHLSRGEKINHFQPAADPLFGSSAQVYGAGAVGVVLSGSSSDGSRGAELIIAAGGLVFTQSQESCTHASMPLATARRCKLGPGLSPHELGELLVSLAEKNDAIFFGAMTACT